MRWLATFIFLVFVKNCIAQFDWQQWENSRLKTERTAMLTLASWAAANIATGAIMTNYSSGIQQHFHRNNAYWNLINLSIAGIGYYSAGKPSTTANEFDVLRKLRDTEKSFLFNTALDASYMLMGLWLMERSVNDFTNRELLMGTGSSLLMQGGFLMLFDLMYYWQFQKKTNRFLHQWQISSNPMGLGLRYTF